MGRRYGLVFGVLLAGCIEGSPGEPGQPGVGTPGDKGDPGDPGGPVGDPSISAVLPSTVYREHDVDVTISGFATTWNEAAAPAVDFGPGITAGPVSIASPTSLLTRIVIDEDAALGPRDVTVGGLVFKSAFTIDAPLSVSILQDWGSPKQGSVMLTGAIQKDVGYPFAYAGASADTLRYFLRNSQGELSDGFLVNGNAYALTAVSFIDVLTPPGPIDGVVQDVAVNPTRSVAPGALTVEARTPIDLTGPTTGTVTAPRETLLYKVESPAAAWVHLAVGTDNLAAAPFFFELPDTGLFADRAKAPLGPILLPTISTPLDNSLFKELHVLLRPDEEHYVVYWDPSPEKDYDFDLDLQASDPMDPIVGAIDTPEAVDFYLVTADAGETLVVQMGDGPTSVCGGSFAPTVAVIRESDNAYLFVDQTSACPGNPAPIALTVPTDGRYLVAILASQLCQGQCPVFDYSTFIGVFP